MRGLLPTLSTVVMLAACGPTGGDITTTTNTTAAPSATTTTLQPEDFAARATPILTDRNVAELEDGLYIGYITAISTEGLTGGPEIQFDLGVWFDGDEADAMAAEDGEESPRPNGYYIRNLDPSHLLIEVSSTVRVSSIWYFYHESELERRPVGFAEIVAAMNPPIDDTGAILRASPWWITITDGRVVAIDEQYIP